MSKEKSKLSKMTSKEAPEQLVQFVRPNHAVYAASSQSYKDVIVMENLCKSISQELDFPGVTEIFYSVFYANI